MNGVQLDIGSLIEKMDRQIESWDADEPRSLWWGYQHDFLEARNALEVVNEGPPVYVLTALHPKQEERDEMSIEEIAQESRKLTNEKTALLRAAVERRIARSQSKQEGEG